jgi:hypothetical protein
MKIKTSIIPITARHAFSVCKDFDPLSIDEGEVVAIRNTEYKEGDNSFDDQEYLFIGKGFITRWVWKEDLRDTMEDAKEMMAYLENEKKIWDSMKAPKINGNPVKKGL